MCRPTTIWIRSLDDTHRSLQLFMYTTIRSNFEERLEMIFFLILILTRPEYAKWRDPISARTRVHIAQRAFIFLQSGFQRNVHAYSNQTIHILYNGGYDGRNNSAWTGHVSLRGTYDPGKLSVARPYNGICDHFVGGWTCATHPWRMISLVMRGRSACIVLHVSRISENIMCIGLWRFWLRFSLWKNVWNVFSATQWVRMKVSVFFFLLTNENVLLDTEWKNQDFLYFFLQFFACVYPS